MACIASSFEFKIAIFELEFKLEFAIFNINVLVLLDQFYSGKFDSLYLPMLV